MEHDSTRVLLEAHEPVRKMQLAAHRLGEDRLHVLLRQIDDERKARVPRQYRKLNRLPRLVGLPIDVTDLVDPHAAPEHGRDDAETAPNLERPRQGRARLGFGRQAVLVLEQDEWDAVMREAQRGRKANRARPHDRHRQGHGRTAS